MSTIAEYLTELIAQRDALADNLVTMGVPATHSEKFNTLVQKVLDIVSGVTVDPYTIVYRHNYVNTASGGYANYVYQASNQNTTMWWEVKANTPYMIVASDNPGTRFRWIFSENEIAETTVTVQCVSVLQRDNCAAFYSGLFTPTTDGYLGGSVDNAGNYDKRAYLIDLSSFTNEQ